MTLPLVRGAILRKCSGSASLFEKDMSGLHSIT